LSDSLVAEFWELLFDFDLQGLSEIKDELFEIPLIDKLLELLPERLAVDYAMTYPVMECTVVVHPGAL